MKNITVMTSIKKNLATPNDLSTSAKQTISKVINPLIADIFALYIKTKNYHWHMSGPHYRDYHLLLDEQAAQLFAMIDVLAERVRKLGGLTIRSINHIKSLQRIQDDNDSFVKPKDMLKNLLDDNKELTSYMREAHEVCADNNDVATASILEIYLDEGERRTWFLFETLAE
jgi:starvation-inducible DNA-binding protein